MQVLPPTKHLGEQTVFLQYNHRATVVPVHQLPQNSIVVITAEGTKTSCQLHQKVMEKANEKLFSWLQLPFKLLGFNVLDPRWKFSPLTLLTVSCFIVQHYCSAEFFLTHLNTLDILTECVSVSSIGSEILIRMGLLVFYREILIDTIGAIRNQSVLFQKSCGFKQLNREFYRAAFRTMSAIGCMYMSTTMFELLPIFFPDPKKNNLPLPMYLPIIPSDVTPYWHINYACHGLINGMSVCFLIAVDCSMAVSILAAVYQIRGLKQCLLELDSSVGSQALHRELVFIVQTHVSVRKFARQLKGMYAGNLLVIFCFICLILCMGLNVIAADIWSPIWFFLLAALFKLFLLCYFGNRLKIESDTLADCVYSIDWLSMPMSEQRLVLLIIANAQPPLELNGIFMPLSMASFLSIMKASYSYFTLLH